MPSLTETNVILIDALQHREAIAIWSGLEREGKLDLDTSARYAFDELAAGDLPAGIARFESVLAQDRTRIRDLYFLARAQIADGRPKQAVSLARRLVEYEPESVMARELLGRALLEAGELEAAHGATTAALELFPNTVGLKILRAEIAIATGDIDGAGRQLTVLAASRPAPAGTRRRRRGAGFLSSSDTSLARPTRGRFTVRRCAGANGR